MKKILIEVSNDSLYFKSKRKFSDNQSNILNTNIISDNEITFTDEYILENEKIVTSFLSGLVTEHNIDKVVIYNNSLEELILKLIKNVEQITSLILKDNVPISYKMCEYISKSNIKLVSCYNLQDFLLEFLDKFNIVVEIRNEVLFVSNFMQTNSLSTYSKIFYKRTINIIFPLSKQDRDDLEAFFNINKYLKNIHISKINLKDLELIYSLLNVYKRKGINIIIHDNVTNIELVSSIKKHNIKNKKIRIRTSLSYSREFLKNNLLKQTNSEILKITIFLIISLITVSFTLLFLNNYLGEKEVLELNKEIKETIKRADTEKIIEILEEEQEQIVYNEYIASLLTVNKDTSGWIKMNNTEIDYPTVKGVNNNYYLRRNFNKQKAYSGWIFLDARNKINMSDDNTIVYGHNFFESNIMFGTLLNIKDPKWRNKKENLIIQYDTLYESLEYEIFSYYIIAPVDDYLRINYKNDLDRLTFYQMLQKRSEFDFKVELAPTDKIITLSTCENGGRKRLVVHGKLKSAS